jgi:anti-sigma factor RsiW
MELMKNNCAEMDSKLADLLLEPEKAPAKVQAHVAECDRCRKELAELRATLALLDTWEAPEPNPYFMTRMEARLREERAAAPASWISRLRARFVYGPSMHVRPLAAMALSVLLLLGGGTYVGVTNGNQQGAQPPQAAVVHDLQTLDNNAQLLDQMEALSATSDNNNGN